MIHMNTGRKCLSRMHSTNLPIDKCNIQSIHTTFRTPQFCSYWKVAWISFSMDRKAKSELQLEVLFKDDGGEP